MTANESYTLDQLSPYTEHKLRYSFAKQTIVIPYLDLPEDCYKICVVVKDNKGNRAIKAGIAYNKIMAKSGVEYTIVQDSSNTSNCQLVADFVRDWVSVLQVHPCHWAMWDVVRAEHSTCRCAAQCRLALVAVV